MAQMKRDTDIKEYNREINQQAFDDFSASGEYATTETSAEWVNTSDKWGIPRMQITQSVVHTLTFAMSEDGKRAVSEAVNNVDIHAHRVHIIAKVDGNSYPQLHINNGEDDIFEAGNYRTPFQSFDGTNYVADESVGLWKNVVFGVRCDQKITEIVGYLTVFEVQAVANE